MSQLLTIVVFLYWFIRRDSLYCRLSFKRAGQSSATQFAQINKLA